MVSALLYLQYHSFKNRIERSVSRLQQPKYLIGAVVGGLYFYFYFFRYLFFPSSRAGGLMLESTGVETLALYQSAAAFALMLIVLFAWLIPQERASLTFTEAEVAFLFPAPISRRGLIHYKLLRSQLRIFFTTFLLVLATRRFGGHGWFRATGWWLVLSTLNLHFLGASFSRTLLLDRGITTRARRMVVMAVALALAAVVFVWARKTLPAPDWSTMSVAAMKDYFGRLLQSGPLPYLLAPFRLVVLPYFAPDLRSFLLTLPLGLVILLAHYAWVAGSDASFEDASIEASQRQAAKIAHYRAGNWQLARGNLKRRDAPFLLKATGSQAIALVWKNLISVGQIFTLGMALRLTIVVVVLCVLVFSRGGSTGGAIQMLGTIAAVFLAWSLLFGPRILRQDLRQDLPLADILKAYPMAGWEVVLGEILAPTLILAACQWLLLLMAGGLMFRSNDPHVSLFFGCGLGAAVLLPVVDFILLLIPNAAVLLFPSWMQIGRDAPRGFEATGQRLIFLLAQLVILTVAIVPAALVAVPVFIVLQMAIGLAAAAPCAAAAGALVLAAEAGLCVMFLGRLFERFDLSSELNS